MTSSFSRIVLALGVLAFLSGCTTTGGWDWFNLAHDADEAPPPDAAPRDEVESQPLSSQPAAAAEPQAASNAQQTAVAPAAPKTQVAMLTPPSPPPAPVHTKVALLLPLSGKNAALGKAMLNAAQMAVFDMSASNFELMPRDTGNDEAGAVKAARDAVSSGAQLLIGPLFAAQVPGVKAIAEPAGINVLTLSTDTSIAAPGLFVMGFTPGAQVDRIVDYAARQDIKRFAALVPDNAYGQLVGQAFQLAVARRSGTVVDIETYNPVQHSAGKAIAALAGMQSQIQALFLPEGGEDLAKIAGQLSAAGFDNHRVHLLGTGLWDDADLGRRVPFLSGGWYAASDPAVRRSFTNSYARAYGQEPPRLATLAYDATALAAVLARRGASFDRVSLTNPNGFAGVDGIFRLTPDGFVERGLAVDEVTPDGAQVIAAAPVTFASER